VESSAVMASTKIIQKNKSHILYDACVISKPSKNLFDPEWLAKEAEIQQIGQNEMAMGRGSAWFVDYNEQQWVLRHYRRGGMVARWNKELYFGFSLGGTRAWQEWYLLNSMFTLGLPVPQPVAACVSWPYSRAAGLYKAAIIVQKIPGAMTLAEKCQQHDTNSEVWKSVGRCIKKFHDQNIYHADLNANNILFDQGNKAYLIDFDKGNIRPGETWKSENLKRLHRSLLKLQGMNENFNFSDADWLVLMDAYN
jgi:3-deoxy-D-manno-octulosonic acid kinase